MKVRFTPRALADLDNIHSYLIDRSPSGSRRVASAIEGAVELVRDHPEVGRLLARGVRRYPVPHLPYLLLYRVSLDAEELQVLTIRHAARRPYLD